MITHGHRSGSRIADTQLTSCVSRVHPGRIYTIKFVHGRSRARRHFGVRAAGGVAAAGRGRARAPGALVPWYNPFYFAYRRSRRTQSWQLRCWRCGCCGRRSARWTWCAGRWIQCTFSFAYRFSRRMPYWRSRCWRCGCCGRLSARWTWCAGPWAASCRTWSCRTSAKRRLPARRQSSRCSFCSPRVRPASAMPLKFLAVTFKHEPRFSAVHALRWSCPCQAFWPSSARHPLSLCPN